LVKVGEHYLSATGALLQDLEGEGIAEIKSLLIQLDKALGASQVLVSGALTNLTLSKRSEILDKSSVNETLKDSRESLRPSTGFDPNKLDMALSQVGTNLPKVELKIW
jgi:hypothetical protein